MQTGPQNILLVCKLYGYKFQSPARQLKKTCQLKITLTQKVH